METKNSWILGWLLALALVVGLAGCGGDTSTEWDSDRTVGGIFGIVNDSLALIVSKRCYVSTTEYLLSSEDDYECTHSGLHLVNYRTKQSPLWSDTLDNGFGFMGQISDSVLYGGGVESRISFWKIGNKPITKAIKSWSGACSPRLYAERVRPWKGGTFIVLGNGIPQAGDSCQYAVLDTSLGTVEMARFTGSDIWLSKCEDISYFNGKATCLRKSAKQACGLELVVDGITADSLKLDSCTFLYEESVGLWMGRYANIDIYHDSWETHRIIRSQLIKTLDGIRFETDYPPVWEGYNNNFIDSLRQEIRYTDTDIFILNGVGL